MKIKAEKGDDFEPELQGISWCLISFYINWRWAKAFYFACFMEFLRREVTSTSTLSVRPSIRSSLQLARWAPIAPRSTRILKNPRNLDSTQNASQAFCYLNIVGWSRPYIFFLSPKFHFYSLFSGRGGKRGGRGKRGRCWFKAVQNIQLHLKTDHTRN